MIRDGLYHTTVFFPEGLVDRIPRHAHDIVYCPHAREKAKERRIKNLPNRIDDCKIPEIEVKDGEIVKAMYKTKYARGYDICLVFHIKNNLPYMVRTVWINNKHQRILIDENRYVHA